MAILEQKTKHYYRIDFDECNITGLRTYVAVKMYASEDDRKKEKERIEPINNFIQKLGEYFNSLTTKISTMIKEHNIKEEDVYDFDNREKYPELRLLQDEMNALEMINSEVLEKSVIIGTGIEIIPTSFSLNINNIIEKLGFKKEWIEDPVRILFTAEIYAGDYKGENITQKFYYDRLKTVMVDTIVDV